tara:strand:+ start:186527 stop:188032 length:1506 start_codon:yes stop_codon:yes gene_type:complete
VLLQNKFTHMKKSHRYFIPFLMFSLILTSCNEDDMDPVTDPVIVQFSTVETSFAENAESQSIAISFSKPANDDGTISLSIDGGTSENYTTVPASMNGLISLPVAKGASTATIQLVPVDNSVVNESITLTIKLKTVTTGFEIGTQNEFKAIITDDESPESVVSEANFISQNATLIETNETGLELQIHFSKPLVQEGQVIISYQSIKATEQHFRTEPALENGKLTLYAALNSSTVSFKVFPINNSIITGELEVMFRVDNTSGSITKGTNLMESVKISDDELTGKPKGYQTEGGSWGLKETIEYNERGDIYKVLIEKSTPAYSAHTETYYYDAQHRIERISQYENIDVLYTWHNNEISKSEEVNNGIVTKYTLYDYDNYGNVSGTANYSRKDNSDYRLDFTILYLYFLDGNLYKKMMYTPQNGEDVLVKTETFEHYTDGENPFPMVKILPNKNAQKKLPLSYQLEEGGANLSYTFSYEFRTDGLAEKRIASGGNVSETALYFYY